jgi:hypothetical protein
LKTKNQKAENYRYIKYALDVKCRTTIKSSSYLYLVLFINILFYFQIKLYLKIKGKKYTLKNSLQMRKKIYMKQWTKLTFRGIDAKAENGEGDMPFDGPFVEIPINVWSALCSVPNLQVFTLNCKCNSGYCCCGNVKSSCCLLLDARPSSPTLLDNTEDTRQPSSAKLLYSEVLGNNSFADGVPAPDHQTQVTTLILHRKIHSFVNGNLNRSKYIRQSW